MKVVIKVNDEVKQKMIEYYKDKKRDKVIPYVVFKEIGTDADCFTVCLLYPGVFTLEMLCAVVFSHAL